jgi:hypothetical protein
MLKKQTEPNFPFLQKEINFTLIIVSMPRGKVKGASVGLLPPKGGCNKVAVLGTGTYGIVESYRLKDGTDYAVKTSTKDLRQADLREISLSRYLGQHPCIIDVLAAGFRQGGKLYMVMEQGIDVRKYIDTKNDDISVYRQMSICYQLACGVDYMHSKGVMHRDLKPDNMLIFPDGSVKICDFGLAKALSCVEGTGMTKEVLSAYYRGIELLLGGRYDQSIDMWSVGCIMYEVCAPLDKKDPYLFSGGTEAELIKDIANTLGTLKRETFDPLIAWRKVWDRQINYPTGIQKIKDHRLVRIITRCLDYDTKKRMTAKELVADPYFDFVRNAAFEVKESDRKNCIELLERATFDRVTPKIDRESITLQEEMMLKQWMAGEVIRTIGMDSTTYFFAIDLLYSTAPKVNHKYEFLQFCCGCLLIASMMKDIYPYREEDLAERMAKIHYKPSRFEVIPKEVYKRDIAPIANYAKYIAETLDFKLVKSTCYELYKQYRSYYPDLTSGTYHNSQSGLWILFVVSFHPSYFSIDPKVLALSALKLECDFRKIKFLHAPQLDPKATRPVVKILKEFIADKSEHDQFTWMHFVYKNLVPDFEAIRSL